MACTRTEYWIPILNFLDQPEIFITESGHWCGKAVLKDGIYFYVQNSVTKIWVTHDPSFSAKNALDTAAEAGARLEAETKAEVRTEEECEVITKVQAEICVAMRAQEIRDKMRELMYLRPRTFSCSRRGSEAHIGGRRST